VGRLEKRRYRRRLRLRIFVGLLLCLALFYCGLAVVDGSLREMLGKGDDRPIFGVYGLDEQVIKLEFAGSEVSIDKSEWVRAYETVKGRLAEIFARY
jgi:predicted anti-sigma-YlaC factor YlaD